MTATTTEPTTKDLTAARPWQTGEPPHDREVVIIGKTIEHEDCTTYAEGICTRARWSEEFGHWQDTSGLSVRRYADSDLIIHFWAELPLGPTWPVHISEAAMKTESEVAA